MPILQNWMPWTGPAERFCLFGAKSLKNMSSKIHPVKTFSGKDDLRPGSRTGVRGRKSEIGGNHCAAGDPRLEA